MGFNTFLFGNISVFVGMEGVLLIVGCELESKDDKDLKSKLIVCCGQRGMWLENGGNICGKAKKEEKDVLSCGDESKVCDLEEDGMELGAKNCPTVILVFSNIDVGENGGHVEAGCVLTD